jgi:hypothetical protein
VLNAWDKWPDKRVLPFAIRATSTSRTQDTQDIRRADAHIHFVGTSPTSHKRARAEEPIFPV